MLFSLSSILPLALTYPAEPAEMSGPEVAKTPGGGAPGKEGKEPVANGHSEGESNPFAEYMWMENEEEYNRQVSKQMHVNTTQALTETCNKNTSLGPLILPVTLH